MALLSDYTAGTISVAANGTVVTGVGTGWSAAQFQEGDWFIANGWVNVIASVDSNTSLTLTAPYRGTVLSGAPYRLRYMSDGSRSSAQARELINMLGGSGNIEAFAGLIGSANKIPMFTGPGTMTLVNPPVADTNGNLAAISGLTSIANTLAYFTGPGTAALTALTAWGRGFIGSADTSAAQTALGISAFVKTLLSSTTGANFLIALGTREFLSADRTYYVRTDGNDSNTGLTNTAGGAFLTLQAAYNKVRASIDFGGNTVTIKINTGTYAPVNFNSDWVGGGNLIVEGDTVTPTNVHVSSTTVTSFRVTVPISAPISIRGFQLTFAGSSIAGVSVDASCRVNLQSIRFNGGSSGFNGCIRAIAIGAVVTLQGNALSFVGSGASCLLQVGAGGQISNLAAVTFTVTGNPAWSWVGVVATDKGLISFAGLTFSGTATGTRYSGSSMSLINTGGGGANFFPGSGAGSVNGGATYL